MLTRYGAFVRVCGAAFVGLALFAGVARGAEQELTGSLKVVRGIKVLTLTGTPRSNGYARGYLMAKEIHASMTAIGGMMHRFLPAGVDPGMVGALVLPRIARPAHDVEEIEGVVEGMRAKLGERGTVMENTGKALTADDIWCSMALPDVGCSAFAAWGVRAGGGMVIGRNFDYIGRELFGGSCCVVVCRPQDPRRRPWLDLSLSPLPGASTALTADGVFIAVLDASATGKTTTPGRLRPFVIRDYLNAAGGTAGFAETAAAFFRAQPILRGTNFILASPAAGALVLEYDGNRANESGVTVRLPEPGCEWIAVTNHFRARTGPKPCGRYDALVSALRQPDGAASRLRTVRDGWRVITRASVDSTLLTAVYCAAERKLLFSFTDGKTPAHKREPIEISIDDVFAAGTPRATRHDPAATTATAAAAAD